MNKINIGCILILMVISSCKDNVAKGKVEEPSPKMDQVTFNNDEKNQKVDVLIDGNLFTSYVYDGKTPKPVLYPVITKSGKKITRGFPLEPVEGERVDHPHHVGIWFNYGDVNGLDFWNNSYAIKEEDKHKYGTIHHQQIVEVNAEKGTLITKASWDTSDNKTLLEETTEFAFGQSGDTRKIIRTTILKALEDVSFKDNKEGMIAIRVTRGLELPSDRPDIFMDANGIPTEVKVLNNEGVNGNYLTSEGKTGEAAWGTRAKWTTLYGKIADEPVSVTIMDHPNNVGYPTYWHARGYGLFAANPLGQEVFSEGKEKLNFSLAKGDSVTFKYTILVHNGEQLTQDSLNKYFSDFSKNH
jgi:hypothetical protein